MVGFCWQANVSVVVLFARENAGGPTIVQQQCLQRLREHSAAFQAPCSREASARAFRRRFSCRFSRGSSSSKEAIAVARHERLSVEAQSFTPPMEARSNMMGERERRVRESQRALQDIDWRGTPEKDDEPHHTHLPCMQATQAVCRRLGEIATSSSSLRNADRAALMASTRREQESPH